MKRTYSALFLLLVSVGLFSCIKNTDPIFTNTQAELDAAVWNANAAGVTYPILTRTPAYNRPTNSTDSVLRRYSGTVRLRVNLNGPTFKSEQTVGYVIFNYPFAAPADSLNFPGSNANQAPATLAGRLQVLNAVPGTHYSTLSGKISIPADSSFGYINVPVLNPGASAQARFVGIHLDSSGTIRPAVNYSSVGLVIDQR